MRSARRRVASAIGSGESVVVVDPGIPAAPVLQAARATGTPSTLVRAAGQAPFASAAHRVIVDFRDAVAKRGATSAAAGTK